MIVTVVLLVVAAFVILQVIGGPIARRMILRPVRLRLAAATKFYDYATPADFGRQFEAFEVPTTEVVIRGWLMRANPASRRAVVLIHGISDSRVGMLHLLPALDPLDVNVALIDLRAHGESGGDFITYGVRERGDIKAVIDWLIAHDLAAPGQVALIGYSLGGAMALQAAAADHRIAAVITDGAFGQLRPMVYRRARRIFGPVVGLAAMAVSPLGMYLAERRARFSIEDASPVTHAAKILAPVLLIHGEADHAVPVDHAQALKAALGDRAELWILPDVGHLDAFAADPDAYTDRVRQFLGRHLVKAGCVND